MHHLCYEPRCNNTRCPRCQRVQQGRVAAFNIIEGLHQLLRGGVWGAKQNLVWKQRVRLVVDAPNACTKRLCVDIVKLVPAETKRKTREFSTIQPH